MTDDADLPETLTLDEAYRAALFLTDLYVGTESSPDEGLVLFHQYLQSDLARWEDWKEAVGQALAHRGGRLKGTPAASLRERCRTP